MYLETCTNKQAVTNKHRRGSLDTVRAHCGRHAQVVFMVKFNRHVPFICNKCIACRQSKGSLLRRENTAARIWRRLPFVVLLPPGPLAQTIHVAVVVHVVHLSIASGGFTHDFPGTFVEVQKEHNFTVTALGGRNQPRTRVQVRLCGERGVTAHGSNVQPVATSVSGWAEDNEGCYYGQKIQQILCGGAAVQKHCSK